MTDAAARSGQPAAFSQPHLIAGLDPETRFALVQALAARIATSDLHLAKDRTRQVFWQHCDRQPVHAEAFASVIAPRDGELGAYVFRLDGLGLHLPTRAHPLALHYLPDDVFVHGPPLPAMPLHARATLRARLFKALRPGHELRADQSFPNLDHTRTAPQRWTWDPRSDGETSLELSPGSVLEAPTPASKDPSPALRGSTPWTSSSTTLSRSSGAATGQTVPRSACMRRCVLMRSCLLCPWTSTSTDSTTATTGGMTGRGWHPMARASTRRATGTHRMPTDDRSVVPQGPPR